MPRTLPDCMELVRYARGLRFAPPPLLDNSISARVEINVHDVPHDVAHQILRVTDDLPWRVRNYATNDTLQFIQLEVPAGEICLYTHERQPDHPIPTGEPDR